MAHDQIDAQTSRLPDYEAAERHIRQLLASGGLTSTDAIAKLTALYSAFGNAPELAGSQASNAVSTWAGGRDFAGGFQTTTAGPTVAPAPAPTTAPTTDPAPVAGVPTAPLDGGALGPLVPPNLISPFADPLAAQERLTEDITGRRQTFFDFLAGSPFVQSLNPFGRRQLEERFDPLRARFALEDVLKPSGDPGQTFRSFLGGRPGQLTQQDFQSLLPQTAQFFPVGGAAALNTEQIPGRELLSQNPVAQNIITQAFASGLSPLLRQFAGSAIGQRVGAFRDINPDAANQPLFGEFVRRGFQF